VAQGNNVSCKSHEILLNGPDATNLVAELRVQANLMGESHSSNDIYVGQQLRDTGWCAASCGNC
jgi:hypothetical protein